METGKRRGCGACRLRMGLRGAVGLALALAGVTSSKTMAALPLATERASPWDLAITAGLVGVPEGEVRYVAWRDLVELPTSKLTLTGEFVPGPQEVTILFLDELRRELPVEPSCDTVEAWCTDGYFSVYSADFIDQQKPFVVLKINGNGPDKWPPEGLTFNPGPYVITVNDQIAPDSSKILDVNHKRPWGVDRISFGAMSKLLEPASTGEWSKLSGTAQQGRTIWLNSCASCHIGPQGMVGGSKSGRPFEVVQAHAKYNAAYFADYVRDPKQMIAGAKMEPHPHYDDAQMKAIIAFIVAEKP